MYYVPQGVTVKIVWDDSKTLPHYEVLRNDYSVSCDFTDNAREEAIREVLAQE